ncbi:MAG TPA: hypothetical protein ENI30_07935, partial [Gammaproteobacteria bacterium]|nr:hypothetical protein [Gammaproteobacteria bacterium]
MGHHAAQSRTAHVGVEHGHRVGFHPGRDAYASLGERRVDPLAALHIQHPSGVLRFGAIPTTLSMVPMLTDYCLRPYPDMRHEVYTLATSQMLQKISNFELDLGMTYLSDGRLREFQTLPLFKERYVLITRDDSLLQGATELTWEDVAALPLCLLTANMQCRQDAPRPRQHPLSVGCEPFEAPAALDHTHAQFLLKAADGTRQRRLG